MTKDMANRFLRYACIRGVIMRVERGVYAKTSCSIKDPDYDSAMRLPFKAMPALPKIQAYQHDLDAARTIMYDGAERWATGARSWWVKGANERNAMIRIDGRVMDQGSFEFILRTTFDYHI